MPFPEPKNPNRHGITESWVSSESLHQLLCTEFWRQEAGPWDGLGPGPPRSHRSLRPHPRRLRPLAAWRFDCSYRSLGSALPGPSPRHHGRDAQPPASTQDTPVRSLAATPRDLTICIHLIHLSASTRRQACSLQAMGEEPAFLVFVFILQTEGILDLHLKRALLT